MRAVGTTIGLEAPALDGACEALALGGTGHIDQGALREQLSGQLLTRLELFGVIGADLSEVTTRGDASLGEVAGKRLSHLGRVNLAVAKLNSLVAVGLFGLDSSHHVGGDVNEGHRNEETVLVPDLRHAELLAQQCGAIRHNGSLLPYSLISMFTSAGRSMCIRESTAFGVGSTMSMRRL